MKRFLISFVAVLVVTCFTTVSVFADNVSNDSLVPEQFDTTFYVKTSDSKIINFINAFNANKSNYVVSVGRTKNNNKGTLSKDELLTIAVYKASVLLNLTPNYNAWNVIPDYLYNTGSKNMEMIWFDGYFNKSDSAINCSYSVEQVAQMRCVPSDGNPTILAKCPLSVTSKIRVNLKVGEPPPPPKPPDPPIPPDPPAPPFPLNPTNPEMIPWYPSDGLTFLDGHIKQTTGTTVTVSIGIFAIIMGVLVMIRIVKMFSKG